MNTPVIIGITGGIGSGKSTLADLFRTEGYLVYDSDKEARRLQNENPIIKQKIQTIFGDVYTNEGLNRSALAKIVFANPDLLTQLNNIVHPVVRKDFRLWISDNLSQKLLFVESAILFENGFNKLIDKVIVITASESVRIKRVIKRDKVSEKQVRDRMANQISEEEKISKADFVIHSDDNQPLIDKMKLILEQLSVIR